MKANEAPKKIYLQVCGDCPQTDCEGCKFEDLEDNITWCKDRIFPKDIEYIRTDAFIEKACEFISLNVADYIDVTHKGGIERLALQERFIEEFKKYMEGE